MHPLNRIIHYHIKIVIQLNMPRKNLTKGNIRMSKVHNQFEPFYEKKNCIHDLARLNSNIYVAGSTHSHRLPHITQTPNRMKENGRYIIFFGGYVCVVLNLSWLWARDPPSFFSNFYFNGVPQKLNEGKQNNIFARINNT